MSPLLIYNMETIVERNVNAMEKEILVFIFSGFADWEIAYICSQLNSEETGYSVKTLSLDLMPKTSMGGLRVIPDYSVFDYPADYAMLILIGGEAWIMQLNNAVLPVVKDAAEKGIPVAGICNAVNFLAENGFLDQIKHTGNTLAFMRQQAPHYQGEDFYTDELSVSDSGVVTANGLGTLEFAEKIMKLLKAKPEDAIDVWYTQNKTGIFSGL